MAREGSIAVGDSENDIKMLEMAERPIAFNPTIGLYAEARSRKWEIVVERKNVIYRLEPGTDGYVLG